MPLLNATLRRTLERQTVEAREAALRASDAAIRALAVHQNEAYGALSEDERRLRRALRTKSRQLGADPERDLGPLMAECAYEQWHRMLFARFLAENNLLMHPEGVPVTLEECAELAQEEGDPDAWAAAARYASLMLPGVFRNEDPLLQVRLFPEGRRALERLLEAMPAQVFSSEDGLGWVYQFWQAKAKDEANVSGRKIGGADLPAVTQLFTEDYMVKFLLHNTLGAWWAARHPNSPLLAELDYLRRLDDGSPAAGAFDGWPETAAELKVMDPCCGSGHFLAAAAELLARMRFEEEGLSKSDATDAVLRENVFGLELDARCAQIAAFSLALWAWRRGGYRNLPVPNVACSGIAAGGRPEEWTGLANGDFRLENALRRLHSMFRDAPDLGSLVDPARVAEGRAFARTGTLEMDVAGIEEVQDLLNSALDRDRGPAGGDPASAVFGEAARGIARAASLLRRRYTLVATNVPYLARGKQGEVLKDHLETYYPAGKADLATAFVQRCADYTEPAGSYALVTPQNWLFLGAYKMLRERLLQTQSWDLLARLGSGAFETISGEVVNVALLVNTNTPPEPERTMDVLDASDRDGPSAKARALREADFRVLEQAGQLKNPDSAVLMEPPSDLPPLRRYAECLQGISSTDYNRFGRYFWEMPELLPGWRFQQGTVNDTVEYGGREHVLRFDYLKDHYEEIRPAIRGHRAWGRAGVALAQMQDLPVTLYTGELFVDSVPVIVPLDARHLAPLWAFCSSEEFNKAVRRLNPKLSVNNGYIAKIPFDLERWRKVVDELYPNGLPEPSSADPTQWLFRGTVKDSTAPLQTAVARLLGYRWPDQVDDDLGPDPDGVVCLPAVAGERPAAERLRALLAEAYGEEWSQGLLDRLLEEANSGGKDLQAWLRDDFFAQHCRLFHNRPFVWHVWDGRRDGFSALVNYHHLDGLKLQRLIYSYLGSWIEAQADAARAGVPGADLRLAAARELKVRLEAILHGDPPYDVYVRWKPLHEQPIGWDPDLNDGVRLNVRPFVEAGVLRSQFTVHWRKDRGKDPDGSERTNDLHLTRAEKEEAREKREVTA